MRGGFGRHEYGEPIRIKWLAYEKSIYNLGKRTWMPLQKSFWTQMDRDMIVPWNDFDITEKEKKLWDLIFMPEH